MNNFISFIESNIYDPNSLEKSFSDSTTGLIKLCLEEKDRDAKIKKFFLVLDTSYKETIAIKLPENQKIQQYLKDRANICDYIIFVPKENIAFLTELKGTRMNSALIQLRLSISFLEYIVSIYNEEKELKFKPKKIIKLLIKDSKNNASPINPKNRISYLQKLNKDFVVCTTYNGCNLSIHSFITFFFSKAKQMQV